MACYYPLKGYDIGIKTINNKPHYKIVPYETVFYNEDGSEMDYIEIPCGRCIGCRLAYSRMWADRCLAEATLHEHSEFVTLTYNDIHVPYSEQVIDLGSGELIYKTLRKRDVQLFMKRLRKNYPYDNKLRFFLAGEYGEEKARPHYHAIIFGLKLDDKKFHCKTGLGFNLYTSEFLNSVWSDSLGQIGHVIVADVTWETCAYTARYIMKKQNGEGAQFFKENGIQQEFTLMSRKPGLAKEFYDLNKLDLLRFGEVNISTPKGGRKVNNVKYFKKFLEIEYPDQYNENKNAKIAEMKVIKALKLQETDKSYLELLETAESVKKSRIKRLERKDI